MVHINFRLVLFIIIADQVGKEFIPQILSTVIVKESVREFVQKEK